MIKRIILGGSKGGISRTTTTANVAISFALHGKKVLLLDLDCQSNESNIMARSYYRWNHKQLTINQTLLYSLAHNDVNGAVVKLMKNLYLIPSSFNFRDYPKLLLSKLMAKSANPKDYYHKRIAFLANALKPVEAKIKPDIVLVDIPPSPDIFESSGLYYIGSGDSKGYIFLMLQSQSFSYEGAKQFNQFAQSLVNTYPELHYVIAGVIPTMFHKRSGSDNKILAQIKHDFSDTPDPMLLSAIPYRERIKHYSIEGIPLSTRDYHDRIIRKIYDNEAKEILKHVDYFDKKEGK